MSNGYLGRLLWIDLTENKIHEESIPSEWFEQYLSGYGLAAKILFDRMEKGVDPLGPDNILGFMSGLLTNTGALFSGRWMAVAKSPLTGGWGDANCGGDLSPAIKRTGYDGLFFRGIAQNPVYLLVQDGSAQLVDASDLWGKDTFDTEKVLKEKHGQKCRVACIGQAGENLSLISGIVNDEGRIAARSGLGAVMGSKKLKAIALIGNTKTQVHNRKKLVGLSKAFKNRLDRDKAVDRFFGSRVVGVLGRVLKFFKTQPAMAGELFKFSLRIWGTSGITAMSAETGDSPVKNWRGVGFRDFPLTRRSSRIGDDKVTQYETKKYRCHSCPLGCGGVCAVKSGPYPIEKTHKPEYETLCAFGTLLLVDDVERIYQANELCNRAGIDTISCGVVVAWAFEAFERGLITEKDTDGLKLVWGDGEAMLELVRRIIAARGIGAWLKDGVKRAAEKLGQGSETFAMHAGGQELPMHDPRYDAGYGMAYETEPTPSRHTLQSYTMADLMALNKKTRRMPKAPLMHTFKDRFGTKGKGEMMALVSQYMDLANGCGLCQFGLAIGGEPPVAEWINAATGWTKSFDDYLEIARRIKTIRHAFNLREGIAPKDTQMPARARGEPPLDAGPLKDITPPFDTLRREQYRAMGWDPDTAIPLASTLDELDLPEVKRLFYS